MISDPAEIEVILMNLKDIFIQNLIGVINANISAIKGVSRDVYVASLYGITQNDITDCVKELEKNMDVYINYWYPNGDWYGKNNYIYDPLIRCVIIYP